MLSQNEKRVLARLYAVGMALAFVMIAVTLFVPLKVCGSHYGCVTYGVRDWLWHPALLIAPVAASLMAAHLFFREGQIGWNALCAVAVALVGWLLGSHGFAAVLEGIRFESEASLMRAFGTVLGTLAFVAVLLWLAAPARAAASEGK